MFDSHNSETFGAASASYTNESADLTHGRSNEVVRVLSSSSLVSPLLYLIFVEFELKKFVFVCDQSCYC